MKIYAVANVAQQQEILTLPRREGVEWVFRSDFAEAIISESPHPLFLLTDDSVKQCDPAFNGRPVFINSVLGTLEAGRYGEWFTRINGWPGFLGRHLWELASGKKEIASGVMEALGWDAIFVQDTPGLVSARILCMVINEACLALGDGVAAKEDIDLAMKLGNHYPLGPLEWMEKIGIERIYPLLDLLSQKDTRYKPAPFLRDLYWRNTDQSHDQNH